MTYPRIVDEREGRYLVKFFDNLIDKNRAKLITAESMLAKAQAAYGADRALMGSDYDHVIEKSELYTLAQLMRGVAMDVYLDGECNSLSDAVDVWSYLKSAADKAAEVMQTERSRYHAAMSWSDEREALYQRLVYNNAVDTWSDVNWMAGIMHNVVNRMAERTGEVL